MSIRLHWKKLVGVAALAALFTGSLVAAQQAVVEEGKRKIKVKVNPAFPELARRMSIYGKVKVEVVISPDGRVKTARAIGGHPVLVQPCLDAIHDWRFEPAAEETTQVVEFNFVAQ